MSYCEATFQTELSHWLKANWKLTAALELKICKTNRFRFSQIEDHQIRNLANTKKGLFYYKISDVSFCQLPFDCFTLHKEPAFVVVLFYKPRQPKKFYMLDIDDVRAAMESGLKSLTEDECDRLASHKGILK